MIQFLYATEHLGIDYPISVHPIEGTGRFFKDFPINPDKKSRHCDYDSLDAQFNRYD